MSDRVSELIWDLGFIYEIHTIFNTHDRFCRMY